MQGLSILFRNFVCETINTTMKPILIHLCFRLAVCLIVAGLFCAVHWLLFFFGLCELPTWQMFMAVAVFVYVFIVIYDTYLFIKNR